jgi:hypothetical protein
VLFDKGQAQVLEVEMAKTEGVIGIEEREEVAKKV